jgi:hypothetical protein
MLSRIKDTKVRTLRAFIEESPDAEVDGPPGLLLVVSKEAQV